MAPVLLMDPEITVDPVEEMKLRTWARQHYLPEEERNNLHPIIIDEMRRRDEEQGRRN